MPRRLEQQVGRDPYRLRTENELARARIPQSNIMEDAFTLQPDEHSMPVPGESQYASPGQFRQRMQQIDEMQSPYREPGAMDHLMQTAFLPALGVIETVMTKGQSRGETAIAAMQGLEQINQRRREFEEHKDRLRKEALNQQLQGRQLDVINRQLKEAERESELLDRNISVISDPERSIEDKINAIGQVYQKEYMQGKMKSAGGGEGFETWLAKQGILDQFAEGREIRAERRAEGRETRAEVRQEKKEQRASERKKEEFRAQRRQSFADVQSLLDLTWEHKQAQLRDLLPGGMEAGGGPLLGVPRRALGALRVPGTEATQAFEGQRTEAAAAITRIITGSSRPAASVFEKVRASLPSIDDGRASAARKIAQSLQNAYGLMMAAQSDGVYGAEDERSFEGLRSMSPTGDEASEINNIIVSILGDDAPKDIISQTRRRGQGDVERPRAPAAPAAPRGGMPRVSTQQEYDALPTGQNIQYIAPDGSIRTKR